MKPQSPHPNSKSTPHEIEITSKTEGNAKTTEQISDSYQAGTVDGVLERGDKKLKLK